MACERDFVTAIRDDGEEDDWKKIVRTILDNRTNPEMKYANTVAQIVANCIPKKKGQKIHAATKTFQEIRNFIYDEFGFLEVALPVMFDKLTMAGRSAMISFHSLEDRIDKKFFNQMAGKAINRLANRSQQDRISYLIILTKNLLFLAKKKSGITCVVDLLNYAS